MQPLVLAYHGFGDRTREQDPHNLFVPLEAFGAQVDHLVHRGFTPLDTASYLACLEKSRWPRRSFLITIDDGYVSTLEAATLLNARDVRAVVFVPAGLMGASSETWVPEMVPERLVDASGLRALVEQGVDIGVHGWDHTSMRDAAHEILHRNTVEAKAAIAEVLGRAPALFAYPGGLFDDAAKQAVEDAGFSAGFSVDRNGGRFAIPRVEVNATDTPRTFAMKCSRSWPLAQRLGKLAPGVRRGIHRFVGSARR